MSYIKSTIINGEEILHEAKISKWFFFFDIFFGIIFVLGSFKASQYNNLFLFVGLFFLIKSYITYISTELAFTNKRVIAKVGFIKRDTVEMNISKVETIQVHQSILGRILNYGTIIISGSGNPQAPIKGIAEPIKFRTKFMQYSSNSVKDKNV